MKFVVDVTFVPEPREENTALMPAEQAHVSSLRDQGIIETTPGGRPVAADRAHVWVAVKGDTEGDIQRTMSEMPLYPSMRLTYTPLLDIEARRVR